MYFKNNRKFAKLGAMLVVTSLVSLPVMAQTGTEGNQEITVNKERITFPRYLKEIWSGFDQVALSWEGMPNEESEQKYQIYRQTGNQTVKELVGETTKPCFIDFELQPGQTYTYYVTAVNRQGKMSNNSESLKVTTLKDFVPQIAMKILEKEHITQTSVQLGWAKVPYTDHYVIYREGEKVGETTTLDFIDTGLETGTTYRYVVQAVTRTNELVASSGTLTVTTAVKEGGKPGVEVPGYKGLWKPGQDYEVGDKVTYNGEVYSCIQAHRALGDWQPPIVPALWENVTDEFGEQVGNEEIIDEKPWEVGVSYEVGDVVRYNGKRYSCVQAHTAYAQHFNPEDVLSLWGLYE